MLLCVILKSEIGVVETDHPVGGHKGKSHQGIVEEGEPEKYHRNQAISRMSGQLLFAFFATFGISQGVSCVCLFYLH